MSPSVSPVAHLPPTLSLKPLGPHLLGLPTLAPWFYDTLVDLANERRAGAWGAGRGNIWDFSPCSLS